MEIDWRRKAACDVIADLPENFEDAMKILEFAANDLARMAYHQKLETRPAEINASNVVPLRNFAKI